MRKGYLKNLQGQGERSIVPILKGNVSDIAASLEKIPGDPISCFQTSRGRYFSLNQNSELINLLIWEHETRAKSWRLGRHANFLYGWHMLFNRAFFNSLLPIPVLSFREQGKCIMGSYKPKRNEIGVLDNININPRHFHNEPWEVLCTLLHEEIHQLQENYGKPGKSSRRNYHNRKFQIASRALGILCDRRGRSLKPVTDPFISLLEVNGIRVNQTEQDVEDEQLAKIIVQEDSNKLKKYSCSCDPPINVRVADRRFSARCNLCGENFQPTPPKWRR